MTKTKAVKAHRVLGPTRQVWAKKTATISLSVPDHRQAGLHFNYLRDIWLDEAEAIIEVLQEVRDGQ